MYYLNDDHPEFQYAIYCIVNKGCPYIAPRLFDNVMDVYNYIEELAKNNNRYHRTFYVDNDFYNNQYNLDTSNIYYKVLKRKVLDWEEFNTKEKHC